MRYLRWLDHLPPWLALGSVISTGLFSPAELALMGLPLAAAMLVELLRYDLDRYRRVLEVGALVFFVGLLLRRTELLPTVTLTVFMLCGVRLALGRELAQRRQLLLMGFLLFLTTGISNQDPSFLFWSVAWTALASGVLLVHAWQQSAALRRGPIPPVPLRRILPWTLAASLAAVPFFLVLPRIALGFRPFVNLGGTGSLSAGFSSVLDLGASGPIEGSAEVVLRIRPLGPVDAARIGQLQRDLGLLRGMALESVRGSKWEAVPGDLPQPMHRAGPGAAVQRLEVLFNPEPSGLVPRPYAPFALEDPLPMPLRSLAGGGLAWMLPLRRTVTVVATQAQAGPGPAVWPPARAGWTVLPSAPARGGARTWTLRRAEPPVAAASSERSTGPRGSRRAALVQTDPSHAAARTWSLRAAPGDLPPAQLAERLTAVLRTFRYTLDNPSGGVENPLQDFLERSRAGHCEYFASALALALRGRDVPARVVNGYRLGPWIDAGGYFLVTRSEAHSWVEFWDPDLQAWRVADPTPAAPPSAYADLSLAGALRRWADAFEFFWNRNVVRFSDEDQLAGASWVREKLQAAAAWSDRIGRTRAGLLAAALLLPLLLWRLRARLPALFRPRERGPEGIRGLRPLLRRARRSVPPLAGETLAAWTARLALRRPDRAAAVEALRQAAERVAYGGQPDPGLRRMAAEEARHWR